MRIRTCAGGNFCTGKSVCEIDYDKIKAIVLTKHGVKLDVDSAEDLRTQCHAAVPNRAYGFPTVINWEPNGGEAQVAQVGYGPNAYSGMSARTDAFTLDRYRHYLRAQILNNVEEVFDMYLIDGKNNLYGLNDGEDELAGIPVTIYPGGNDHPGASDKASLVVNVVYQDVEDYVRRLDVVPLEFNALGSVYGLMPVTLEKQGNTNDYKLVEHFGNGDATAKYGELIADNIGDVATGATSAAYDSVNNVITITLSQGATEVALKSAAVLATKGIYGIEPYTA